MSFYLGVIFKELVAVVADRMLANVYTGEKDDSHARIFKINDSTFFIPAGDMLFATLACNGLSQIFGDRPIDLEKIPEYGGIFSRKVASHYSEIKSRSIKSLKDHGIDTAFERFNSLIGGISSTKVLYLINLGDEKCFRFETITKPITCVTIGTEGKEASDGLNELIERFILASAREPEIGQKVLVKEFLPKMVEFVSRHNEFVSGQADLVLIGKEGTIVEIHEDPIRRTRTEVRSMPRNWNFKRQGIE